MKNKKRIIMLLLFGVAAIGFTVVFFKIVKPSSPPPNIVLISLDTLRADYFSPEHMPKTYEWARKNCAVFSNAYSNSTWTSPSHATMFSGLLQSQHKLEYSDSILSPEVPMIQEELRKAGYETLAFVGGGYVSKVFGLDRGFDLFQESSFLFTGNKRTFGALRDQIWEPVAKAEKLVTSAKSSKPVFLFVHTYMVHEYFLYKSAADTYPSVDRNELNTRFIMDEPAEVKRQCYGAAVRETDSRLYNFIHALLSSPLAPNLAIIITSDHGEGLGDKHGDYYSFAHAHAPYSDQIHIPLAIYGMPRGRYDSLICTKDIPTLIRELAGLEKAKQIPRNEFIISENIQYDRSQPLEPRTLAVTFLERRILLDKHGNLFLFADKNDTINLLSSTVAGLHGDLPEDVKQNLRALGYLK